MFVIIEKIYEWKAWISQRYTWRNRKLQDNTVNPIGCQEKLFWVSEQCILTSWGYVFCYFWK